MGPELRYDLILNPDYLLFSQVQCVIQSLNSVCQKVQASTEHEWSELEMPASGNLFILRNFPKLVDQLRAQDKLPALVFR